MATGGFTGPSGVKCIGFYGCNPGETCLVDEDCVRNGPCVQAPEAFGNIKVCSAQQARGSLVAFSLVMTVMSLGTLFCVFIAVRRAIRLRRSIKERREKKKAEARGEGGAAGGTPLQKRCEGLLAKSQDLQRAWASQLEDVNKLYLQEDMRQTQFMFHFLVLATLNCTHGQSEQFTYMYERKLWFLATYLEQATAGLVYAMSPENGVQANKQALGHAQQLLFRTAEYFQLPSPFSQVSTTQVLQRKYDDPQFGMRSSALKQLETRSESFKPAFVKPTETGAKKNQATAFRQVRRYPYFYGLYFVIWNVIFWLWASQVNQPNANFDKFKKNFFKNGFGNSMFGIPPQYTIDAPSVASLQGVAIPVVYGIMHNALFLLGMLPLPLCRGFWRDIVAYFPSLRKFAPVDDLIGLHRQIAYGLFAYLLLGAIIWLAVMSTDCLRDVPKACLAFEPAVQEYFSPIENVLALRFSVFLTWPWMGLLYFARDGPPFFLKNFRSLRENWFEFCYFLHLFIGHFTLSLALISRFDVFYWVLLAWPLYWLDYIRETLFHTKTANLVDAQLFGRAKDGVPTSMRLKFQPQGDFKTGAGQYFYIKVPSVDRIWHPFTLASASNDKTVQAHIGIIAGKNDWVKSKGGPGGWESRNRTWTYKLFEQVSKRGSSVIPAQVRGPYGCSFNDCFNPAYQAAVVVAAGTGLSAAESVLRETLERRKAGIPGPRKFWVVYSCRDEDSLIWCWERIVSLIVKAVEDRVLDIDKLSPRSAMFDWIGIQMYVTQSTPELMKQFNKLNREQGNKVFNLRESIFNRNTIRGGGQVKPAGGIKDVAAMGPAGQMRRGSQLSGFSGASGGSGGSGGYYGIPGYPNGPRGDVEAGSYGGQLQGMRGAAQAIERGNYTDLQMGGSREGVAGKVREWLLNRVLAGSLDDEDTHIERFLYGALESFGDESVRKMSVGFCGPAPLALTISEACGIVQAARGVTVDFVAESQ